MSAGEELPVEGSFSSNIWNDPSTKNPTLGITVLIVDVVLLVVATILYNSISERREYECENPPESVASAASAAAAAVSAVKRAASSFLSYEEADKVAHEHADPGYEILAVDIKRR